VAADQTICDGRRASPSKIRLPRSSTGRGETIHTSGVLAGIVSRDDLRYHMTARASRNGASVGRRHTRTLATAAIDVGTIRAHQNVPLSASCTLLDRTSSRSGSVDRRAVSSVSIRGRFPRIRVGDGLGVDRRPDRRGRAGHQSNGATGKKYASSFEQLLIDDDHHLPTVRHAVSMLGLPAKGSHKTTKIKYASFF